ncbi:MAG: CDP-glycerol glycerophosphotransferase family protein [Acutalibacteraceae bacterium]|jgi:CDP-glycerol glycerophosphotransferase (TagB/SpsB family)
MKPPVLDRVIAAINRIVPKNPRLVCFNSFPDRSDNAFAVYAYLCDHPEALGERVLVWLVEDPAEKLPVGKAVKKRSLRGLWAFWRSGVVFHTHGIFGNIPVRGQTLVSLWHGMPLKTIMDLDPAHRDYPPFGFDYTIATSPLFAGIMSRAFSCDSSRCLVVGQPRNDLLFDGAPDGKETTVLWMPTYRQSVKGDIRIDGSAPQNGIAFLDRDGIERLNAFMTQNDIRLIIKVHPMQDLTPFQGLDASHIQWIKEYDGALYRLVGQADALLTDYSSVYIDYLLLDRPIGFVVDDWDAYRDSRGFVFDDPKSMMPGAFIADEERLYAFLRDVKTGRDPYRDDRRRVARQCHAHTDAGSCARLLKAIGWR